MTKKPGMFSRLRSAISSTLNDAVDAVRDPGQEIALMLDDLAAQVQQSEKDLKQGVVDRKLMERKLEELQKKEADWQARAEQALKLADEKLARAALQQKTDASEQVRDTEAALADQRQLVEQMQTQIKASKQRLQSLNLRRGSLMAQARAAKQGPTTGVMGTSSAANRLDEIEARISEVEAMNEVAAELSEAELETVRLDAQLAELDTNSLVDDELEALKAKMKAKGALPESTGE